MKVAIIFANGFEDIEAIAPFDLLKRAGIDVVSLGLESKHIMSKSHMRIETDEILDDNIDTSRFDMVILPGGLKGAENLRDSPIVKQFVLDMVKTNKKVGAICASPALGLASMGVLNGKKFTCYPGMEKNAHVTGGTYLTDSVVVDGNVITSRGVGTSFAFSYELIKLLTSKENADKTFVAAVIDKF